MEKKRLVFFSLRPTDLAPTQSHEVAVTVLFVSHGEKDQPSLGQKTSPRNNEHSWSEGCTNLCFVCFVLSLFFCFCIFNTEIPHSSKIQFQGYNTSLLPPFFPMFLIFAIICFNLLHRQKLKDPPNTQFKKQKVKGKLQS